MQLSPSDFQLFFQLQSHLNNFIYAELCREKGRTPEGRFGDLQLPEQLKVRQAFIERPELHAQFVQQNPAQLAADELSIVAAWEHRLYGRFIILRHLRGYTVFLSSTEPTIAYGVLGLKQEIEDVIGPQVPVMVEALLLPFRDQVTYDGVFNRIGLSFGPGLRKSLNENYRAAKERFGIVTALPFEASQLSRLESGPVKNKPRLKSPKKLEKSASDVSGMIPSGKNDSPKLFQFRIVLEGSEPRIWREIQVPDETLDDLHEHIQTAMGWSNSHLHQFVINGQHYGDPELVGEDLFAEGFADSTKARLSDIMPADGSRLVFAYEYDFGDGWGHAIAFQGNPPAEPGAKYPRCTDGARACPPEDVGGIPGFANFVEVMENPKHPEHRELRKWYGGRFNSDEFNLAKATKEMQKGLPDWRSMKNG